MGLLLLSAQNDENSNELLVFFDLSADRQVLFRLPCCCSLMWFARVVLE